MENFYYRNKPVVLPAVFLMILVVLGVVSGSYFKGRIDDLQSEANKAKDLNQQLESRLNSLQTVQQDVGTFSEDAVFALPHKNSAILTAVHLRQLAEKENLTIGQLSMRGSSSAAGAPVSTNEFYFEVEGEYTPIANFLKSLATISPIVNIKNINMVKNEEVTSAEVTVVTFWSQLPDQLPAITEPIASLSNSEKQILDEIINYEKPEGIGVNVAPEEPVDRTDPFVTTVLQ